MLEQSHNQKQKADLVIANAAQIVTCQGEQADLIGLITDGWIAVAGEKIAAVGDRETVLSQVDASQALVIDATNKVVAPGFVDSHTHAVFGGSRVREYAAKMTVSDPEKLRQMGIQTGVQVSVDMTRQASLEELFESAQSRLNRMLLSGTTTVEIKTGYGFNTLDELRMLDVNALLDQELELDVISTFLGAHGWPKDMAKEAYMDLVIEEMIPLVSERKLATFCDVWCEDSHFDAKESARILEAGLKAGLLPKIHTDAYSYIYGSDLAADMKVISADHLNYTPPALMRKLAEADVPGVIMPALDFAVKHKKPFDARAMIDSGMTVALATDLCPACWTESMQFVMMLACRQYAMSPAESIRAATIGSAKALGLAHDRGSIEAGKLADLQIWGTPTYENVIYWLGTNVVEQVIKRGKVVVNQNRTPAQLAWH
ncbi:imidazolonepropionase [Brevibacillus centrosporus]|uniref:imidazolonepropionase n=1 Tax=Brevibacillus centrosporus TaxID=54910 RepID=UPI002E1E9D75|nr:imidazolonepropionase [Brevibacillus centrosporus]MED1949023.1 imidazolonepropionase [Brevibacillus centrosporus]